MKTNWSSLQILFMENSSKSSQTPLDGMKMENRSLAGLCEESHNFPFYLQTLQESPAWMGPEQSLSWFVAAAIWG